MPNPFADRGWTDDDYANAIGTLVGEAVQKDGVRGYAAVADVFANRMSDFKSQDRFASKLGTSFTSQAFAKNAKGAFEFSTWSPKETAAFANATRAKTATKDSFLTALNPEKAAKVSPSLANAISLAKQGLDGVFGTGQLRGIAQGATYYDNPDVTAKNKTGTFHDGLERKHGAIQIGDHRFTGPLINASQEFDPVTYNGQLAAPPAADVNFDGVAMDMGLRMQHASPINPVPSGRVEVSELGPLGAPTGFDPSMAGIPGQYGEEQAWGGYTPDYARPMDVGNFDAILNEAFGARPDYSDISAGLYGRPTSSLEGFVPGEAAIPDFSGVHIGMTEQQAIDSLGLHNQRPSENVEVRPGSMKFGNSIDDQVAYNADVTSVIDKIASELAPQIEGQFPGTVAGLTNTRDSFATDGVVDPNFSSATDFLSAPFADHSYISAGLYPGTSLEDFVPAAAATPDFRDVHTPTSEQEAIDRMGWGNQRLSENVEIRNGAFDAMDLAQALGTRSDKSIEERVRDFQRTVDNPEIGTKEAGDWMFGGTLPELGGWRETLANNPPVDYGKTYPDISAGMYPSAQAGFHAGFDGWGLTPDFTAPALDPIAADMMPSRGGLTGFALGEEQPAPSSFHSGFDTFQPTPDFNAPSLSQRQADMIANERVSNFEQGNWARPGSIPQSVINDDIMRELGQPLAPAKEATPVPASTVTERPFDMQGAYLADFEDKLGPRALPAPSVQPITELPALPVTSVAPVRQAPSVAPVQRSVAPVQQAPVRIERAPTLPAATLPQTSFPQSAPTPPERPSGFQGFGDITSAMGAIGAGHASMPSGYNEAWGRTAFSDSVYAGAAYNDLMDAVSKQGGFADRKGVVSDMPASVKGGALGMLGGPLGMVAGAAFGGLKDAGFMPSFSLGSFFGDMFGQGGYDGPYQGAGREGETYSNDRGFSDPGGWGLSVGGDLSGYMDGSAYGGPSGGAQSGGGGGFGGYGNADGSPSSDGPGIW